MINDIFMLLIMVKWNDIWFLGNIILYDRKKWGIGMLMLFVCK